MIKKEAMQALYSSLLAAHGDSPKSLDWPTQEIQERNFHAVTQLFAREQGPFTVYEIGCGLGDMASHLEKYHPLARYGGCDINEDIVNAALRRNPSLRVETRDILIDAPPESDYVVTSGIFNHHLGSTPEHWQGFVFSMLRAMFSSARKGIASNFHTGYVDWKKDFSYHQDPCAVFDFAKRELSRFVDIRHSYYSWEFALFVYRDAQPFVEARPSA